METINPTNTFEDQEAFNAEFDAMMAGFNETAALPQDHPEATPLTEEEINDFVAALDSGVGLSKYDQNFLNEAGIAAGPVSEQQQADAMLDVFGKDEEDVKK